jgi:biopolymer transport protein ExbB
VARDDPRREESCRAKATLIAQEAKHTYCRPMMEILEGTGFWGQGGPVVLVIFLASILALSVFIARMLALRETQTIPRTLTVQVRDLLLRGEVPEALTACRIDDSPLARVYLAGLRHAGKAREDVKEFLSEIGRHEGMNLGRGLPILETVAVVAPLLGLLGTVWGMIDVFGAIEAHGVGDTGALAGGIGTALYTTLAGLLVAIPVRVGHSVVQARVDRVILQMEEEALVILDLLSGEHPTPQPGNAMSPSSSASSPLAVS